MRLRTVVTISLIAVISGFNVVTAFNQGVDARELAQKNAGSIVTVIGEDREGKPVSAGTGFFFQSNLIATDFRVIKDAVTFKVQRPGEEAIEVHLAAVDALRLIGVLAARVKVNEPIKLACTPKLKSGSQAYLLTEGQRSEASSIRVAEAPQAADERLRFDTRFEDQDAGAPILDSNGEVVAIAALSLEPGSNRAEAIPIFHLASLLWFNPCVRSSFTDSDQRGVPGGVIGGVPGGVPDGVRGGVPGGVPGGVVGGVPGGVVGGVPRDGLDNPGVPPSPGSVSPPKVIRKSQGVLQGEAVRRAIPLYPPLAKAARISGSVPIEIIIDEEGEVLFARAVGGHPLLKESALAAARGWKFKPTLLQGEPVKVIGVITFNFQM